MSPSSNRLLVLPKSPIPVPQNAVSLSSARTTKRFPSSGCASAIQIIRRWTVRLRFVFSRWTSGRGGSPKNETASSQTRNKVSYASNISLHRNNCIMSNLRRRLISWHTGCIDYWYQPNKYYERPIRIQLRSLSTLRRKRPWRARDFSLCDLFSQCGLIHLAICAHSPENLCAWSRCVRSLPYDHDTAFCTELI